MKILIFCIPIALLGLPVAHSIQKMASHIEHLAQKDARLFEVSSSIATRIHRIEQLNKTLWFLKKSCLAAAALNPASIAYYQRAGKIIRKSQEGLWFLLKGQSQFFSLKHGYSLKIANIKKLPRGICLLPGQFEWPNSPVVQFTDSNSGSQIWHDDSPTWNYFNPQVLPIL